MNIALERETPAKRYRVKGLEVLHRPFEPARIIGNLQKRKLAPKSCAT